MLVGTGVIDDPAVVGGNIIIVMADNHGAFLAALTGLCVFVSLGSVCAHCLYNGALGWSNLVRVPMRVLVVGLGVLAGIAAVAGIWNHLLDWLNLLGVFVPPLGGVMIAAALCGAFATGTANQEPTSINVRSAVAYAIGGVAGGLAHYLVPELSEAVVGAVVGALAFTALRFASRQRTGATPGRAETPDSSAMSR